MRGIGSRTEQGVADWKAGRLAPGGSGYLSAAYDPENGDPNTDSRDQSLLVVINRQHLAELSSDQP